MTPDELMARCKQYYLEEYPGVDAVRGLPGLESLCREMIAAGLEMAAAMNDDLIREHIQGAPAMEQWDATMKECVEGGK